MLFEKQRGNYMDKIKILIDTDLGSDCDDAGALAVAYNLADMGKTEILAVTHCGSEISGAVAAKAINEWYNRADIPVGRYDKGVFLEEDNCTVYTKPLMELYLKNHEMPMFESAVKVQRKILSARSDVTIVVIGMLNNIAELLRSEPDEISSLSGEELVEKSVKNMYVMGGDFKDLTHDEWNIKLDIKNAQFVSENFPKPIIYCGFEIGENIMTGKNLADAAEDNPIKIAYYTWLKSVGQNDMLRNSWDPITVYCGIEQDNELFKKSENCSITFDDSGRVVLGEGGKDCYLIADASEEKICDVIDELIK